MTQEENVSAEPKADPPAKSENWSFIEPQPIREDQVQNAVKFLSHPKVKGSPIEHRRSFLEKKGLSREEIDEAFQRVPDPPTGRNDVVTTEGRYTIPPSQAHSGAPQQVAPAQPQPPVQQIVGVTPPAVEQGQRKPRLLQVVLGVGILTAVGAGTGVLFQRVLVPKLKAWIRAAASEDDAKQLKQVKKLSPVEEAANAAAAAASTAAIAAAEVASTYQEMLKSRAEEWQHLTSIIKTLENHTQELKTAVLKMGAMSQDMNKPNQMPPVANGSLEERSHKASSRVLGGTTPFMDQLQEVDQIQISNSVKKIERSNGNLGTVQSTTSARPPSREGWNQGSTSMVLQGKAAAYTSHASQINTVQDEPWWRNKKGVVEQVTSSEQLPESTVQITEIDTLSDGDSLVVENSFSTPGGGSTTSLSVSGPSNLGWAPPPVPQTVMPGAAAAIRYRKFVANDDSKETVVSFQSSSGQFQEATATEEVAQSSITEAVKDAGQEELSEDAKTYADVLREEI